MRKVGQTKPHFWLCGGIWFCLREGWRIGVGHDVQTAFKDWQQVNAQ